MSESDLELQGPYAGCECGRYRLLHDASSDPGKCEGCDSPLLKGEVWATGYPFCVHCGHDFKIEVDMANQAIETLRAHHMDLKCAQCGKITRMKPILRFKLEAVPVYPRV